MTDQNHGSSEENQSPGLTGRFHEGVEALQRFVAENGHARVPHSYISNGFSLGAWVQSRRVAYNRGLLAPERQEALEAIPGWTWSVRSDQEEATLALLDAYIAREGHARVPAAHVEDGIKLGSWVNTKRKAYKAGRLSPERVATLESRTGWQWVAGRRDVRNPIPVLEAYIARVGHSNVPNVFVEDGYKLGAWVARQRRNYRQGRLNTDTIQKLESIAGWTWERA